MCPIDRAPDILEKTVAWNGIVIRTPEAWEVDSLESNHMIIGNPMLPALELKWTKTGINRAPETYLKSFVKHSKKRLGIDIEACAAPSGLIDKNDVLEKFFFNWVGNKGRGSGVFIFCPVCMRITMIRFFDGDGSLSRGVRNKILQTFEDHGTGDRILWSIFGFKFSLPADLVLDTFNFNPGAFSLAFKTRNKHRVSVYSWGPASFLLSNKSLVQFAHERIKNLNGDPVSGIGPSGPFAEWVYRNVRPVDRIIPVLKKIRKGSCDLFRICHRKKANRLIGIQIFSVMDQDNDLAKQVADG